MLDQLPLEILNAIADLLDDSSLARLARCSRWLKRYCEPILYGNSRRLNKAVRWACVQGEVDTMNLAAIYGGTLSYVESPSTRWV